MDNPLLTLAEEWEKAAVDNGELSGDCELKNGMWYEGMWYAGMAHGFTAAAAALRSYVERCAYRPGLPSVEAVKAHEARGGRWQVLDPGCHLDPHPERLRLLAAAGHVLVGRACQVPPLLPVGRPPAMGGREAAPWPDAWAWFVSATKEAP